MISRRSFLVGSGVAAGGLAVGGARAAVTGIGRALGEVGRHEAGASAAWPVVEHSLGSRAMGRDVPWAIARPDTDPIGTLVCLHARDCNLRMAFDSVRLHEVAAATGVPLAIVGVDGGPVSYWHPRADGTDAMALVLEELLPAVDAELGVALPRALIGWSMGGYGALLLAEEAADRFRATVAVSPAIYPSFEVARERAFDDEADFAAHDLYTRRDELAALVVRVDCGDGDRFSSESRRFAAGLPGANRGRFGPGGHDDAYWRSMAPEQLRTIAAAITSG